MARGYLAVDGGGSSSEFLLVNEAGEELLHFFVGSTSKKSIGVEGAAVNIPWVHVSCWTIWKATTVC